ncbi:ECF RNA polymerase sigma factor SigE [Streptomyces sp. YIM 121038]|uniref:RNA polymerase sigma factor n=1 Tax=Streptomyces sp. YIM 121038 TaxID=2136401 RepID=UPI001162194C|nr:sigma-70 family RNA polymerase sigma factor [Streptomyces sp. YIM 121038]QCX74642.1 ECF RNA polymerase sigma factor SigE [Streptomyces sp. YIM 121038]
MGTESRSRGGPSGGGLRDPQAFEEFYRRHVDAVTRFVARRVSDPHTVADLTADVFLAVVDSADGYRPGRGSEAAWLFGIGRNVVRAEYRRSSRQAGLGARIAGRRLLDDDDIARLEEKLDAERGGRRALELLAELPESERAVLELVAVDQLTVSEAAAALGTTQVAARVRLHRARRKLRGAEELAGERQEVPQAGHHKPVARTRQDERAGHAGQARQAESRTTTIAYAGGES